jgi:hypothetical protein
MMSTTQGVLLMFSVVFSLCLAMAASAQTASPTSLRGVLLEQLQTTHNNKQWFAPASAAVEGITAEQASWQDGKSNHSIGQLAAHLVFWNRQQLAKFRGEAPEAFSGDNNETFQPLRRRPMDRHCPRSRRGHDGLGKGG